MIYSAQSKDACNSQPENSMNADSFEIIKPKTNPVPFLLSLPHCGTAFPPELDDEYIPALSAAPDDTDWHLDRLYDFAPSLGITTICPKYSRWVIDLNRDPESKPLYDDGRIITALCPVTDFQGRPIYRDGRSFVMDEEIGRRINLYYRPYHSQIDDILSGFVNDFGTALFWDGHSIRRLVPSIQPEPFPDLILGDNERTSCGTRFIDTALTALRDGAFGVAHNKPFKGGYLTRSKGDPVKGIHALQLEMSKDLYMKNDESEYSEEKALPLKTHLRSVFQKLTAFISQKMEEKKI